VADHTRVVVYVKAEDARQLRAEGKEPSEWVRTLVRRAFEKRRKEKV